MTNRADDPKGRPCKRKEEMHPALKKTVLIIIVFAALVIGLPLAGRLIRRGILSLDKKINVVQESETEAAGTLEEGEAKFVTLKDALTGGTAILPTQELLETKIPYTDKEKAVIAANSPLIINEPGPYGQLGARFMTDEEEKEKFTNLAVIFSAYNFGEKIHVQEIEFQDLLGYDTVVLQYKVILRLLDEEGNSAELILDAGHNIDESIFFITTQLPEFFDYEQRQGATETEWEDAYA